MRKADELALEEMLRAEWRKGGSTEMETYFDRLGMAHRRGFYILAKWACQDRWEYGVSLRTGWFA